MKLSILASTTISTNILSAIQRHLTSYSDCASNSTKLDHHERFVAAAPRRRSCRYISRIPSQTLLFWPLRVSTVYHTLSGDTNQQFVFRMFSYLPVILFISSDSFWYFVYMLEVGFVNNTALALISTYYMMCCWGSVVQTCQPEISCKMFFFGGYPLSFGAYKRVLCKHNVRISSRTTTISFTSASR